MDDQTIPNGRLLQSFAGDVFSADVVEAPEIECPLVAVRFVESDGGTPHSITFCSCHIRQLRTLLSEVVEYLDKLDQA